MALAASGFFSHSRAAEKPGAREGNEEKERNRVKCDRAIQRFFSPLASLRPSRLLFSLLRAAQLPLSLTASAHGLAIDCRCARSGSPLDLGAGCCCCSHSIEAAAERAPPPIFFHLRGFQ